MKSKQLFVDIAILSYSFYIVNNFFSIFLKNFYHILSYKCSIFLCSYSPVFQIKTSVRLSVKWEKTDFLCGGSKNQNKCSVFHVVYKLVHLYTNLIFKHLNKNPTKHNKIPTFPPFTPKIQYRTQYRQTTRKSAL